MDTTSMAKNTVLNWARTANFSEQFPFLKTYLELFNGDDLKKIHGLLGHMKKRKKREENANSKKRKLDSEHPAPENNDDLVDQIIKYEVLDEVGESDPEDEMSESEEHEQELKRKTPSSLSSCKDHQIKKEKNVDNASSDHLKKELENVRSEYMGNSDQQVKLEFV